MVVAEGAMMDVGDRDEATETRDEEEARGRKHASRYIDDARPKGRVLRAWETIRKGDLTDLYGPWAPDDGFTGVGVDPERVGRFIRPEPETQAQPNPGTATQPAPTPAPDGATPIVDLVIADLRARAEVGLRTYGTLLHAHNGRRPDIDAYQEDLDALVYRRQVIEEIDDARRVLGASEGETLLAVAERVVARQNRYSDELGEVMDALGRHDDESTADAAKRRMVERATLHDERDEARRRLTSTEADLTAARARITYLEQHLAGAQCDAREQRALVGALRADLAAEMEINTTLRGQFATLHAQHEETQRLAEAERQRDEALERRTHAIDWYQQRFDRLRPWVENEVKPLSAEVAHRYWGIVANGSPSPTESADWRNTMHGLSVRAEVAEAVAADLRAKLAEAEERARRAEAERDEERRRGDRLATRMAIDSDFLTTKDLADMDSDLAGLAAREAQAPSGDPLTARQAAVAAKMRERATPPTSMLATTTVAPSGEPAPVEVSEPEGNAPGSSESSTDEPEAIATLRAWYAIDPAERGDAAAWEIVADAHDTVEAASKMLDAAPEVLRLYDAARAEVAALKARVDEVERARGSLLATLKAERAESAKIAGEVTQETLEYLDKIAAIQTLVATESERASEAEGYLGEIAAMVGSPGIRPSMVPGEVRAYLAMGGVTEPDPVHAPTGDPPQAQPEAPRVEDAAPEAQATTMRPWRRRPLPKPDQDAPHVQRYRAAMAAEEPAT